MGAMAKVMPGEAVKVPRTASLINQASGGHLSDHHGVRGL